MRDLLRGAKDGRIHWCPVPSSLKMEICLPAAFSSTFQRKVSCKGVAGAHTRAGARRREVREACAPDSRGSRADEQEEEHDADSGE